MTSKSLVVRIQEYFSNLMKEGKETVEIIEANENVLKIINNIKEQTLNISLEEFARLKDIETRFTILKDQMIHADYCPIHQQIILGIEKECAAKEKELKLEMLPLVGKKKG